LRECNPLPYQFRKLQLTVKCTWLQENDSSGFNRSRDTRSFTGSKHTNQQRTEKHIKSYTTILHSINCIRYSLSCSKIHTRMQISGSRIHNKKQQKYVSTNYLLLENKEQINRYTEHQGRHAKGRLSGASALLIRGYVERSQILTTKDCTKCVVWHTFAAPLH